MAVDVRYGIGYGMIKKHKVQIFLIELTKTLPQNFQCDGRHCRVCRIDSPAPLAHLILSGHFRTTCGGSRRSSTTWPATRRSSSSLPSSRTELWRAIPTPSGSWWPAWSGCSRSYSPYSGPGGGSSAEVRPFSVRLRYDRVSFD